MWTSLRVYEARLAEMEAMNSSLLSTCMIVKGQHGRAYEWPQQRNKMAYAQYTDWFDVIIEDNIDEARSRLAAATPDERTVLTSGYFGLEDNKRFANVDGHELYVTKPLILAAVSGSLKVFDLLLRHGADPLQLDHNRYNIVHAIVANAFFLPATEATMVAMYHHMTATLEVGVLKLLHKQENHQTLRPLEMAAQNGVFRLFLAIMDTKGVYLRQHESHGMYEYKWYDVTEYESYRPGNRREKSLALFLTLMDKTILTNASTKEIFAWNVFQSWMKAKMKCNMGYMVAWFLSRLIYTVIFLIQDSDHDWAYHHQVAPEEQQMAWNASNATTAVPEVVCRRFMYFPISLTWTLILTVYLTFHSLCIIGYDIYEVVRGKYRKMVWLRNDLRGPKDLVVHLIFYRVCQFILALFVCSGTGTFLSKIPQLRGNLLIDVMHIITCVVCVWSLLFFVQLLPSVGHFVIIIQRMCKDMVHFVLIYILCFIPFAHAWHRFVTTMNTCEVPSTLSVYYQTFVMMLNMVDTLSYMEKVADRYGFLILHAVYVFIVPVLLINFLIALFSHSVSEVANSRDIIMIVQRLSVILSLEDKLGKFAFFRKYYERLQKTCFVCKSDANSPPCDIYEDKPVDLNMMAE